MIGGGKPTPSKPTVGRPVDDDEDDDDDDDEDDEDDDDDDDDVNIL